MLSLMLGCLSDFETGQGITLVHAVKGTGTLLQTIEPNMNLPLALESTPPENYLWPSCLTVKGMGSRDAH
jgi:hypothetical protein